MSVSLTADDVEFLDRYAADHAIASRSAVVHEAVALLRAGELADDYAAAWSEWDEAGEAERWEPTTADGLAPAG